MPNQIADAVDPQVELVKRGARVLFKPKQLVEVRVKETNYWRGLYFDNHDRMAEVVHKLDHDSRIQSIYYVFNEINQKLIEQRRKCDCEKCVRGGLIVRNPSDEQVEQIITGPSQHLTTNEDVKMLNWMFIDVDTLRVEGHEHDCSTEGEKAAAKKIAKTVIAYLDSKGWPQPLLADSGNGFHILPRINLPNTDINISYLLGCLKALAKKFNSPAAQIDDSVFNPARLTRAYGTTTRKGDGAGDRPYRQNRIVDPKGFLGLVTFDQITALADEGPKTSMTPRGDMPLLHDTFDPDDFFRHYEDQGAFEITDTSNWQGHEVKITDHCIISGTKHTGSKLTGFIIGDSFGYHCWSPECNDPNIGDVLRKLHEDGYKHYLKKIWVEESPLLNFDEKQNAFEKQLQEESVGEQYRPPSTQIDAPPVTDFEPEDDEQLVDSQGDTDSIPEKSLFTVLDAKIAEEAAQEAEDEGKKAPPVVIRHEKPIRIGDVKPNQYAEWLLGIIFRDPKVISVDFGFYRKRFEKVAKHLTDTVAETFGAMMLYERGVKRLPSRTELLNFISDSEECEGHRLQGEMIAFVKAIKDDESKTFEVTARRLISEIDWCLESEIARDAYKKLLREKRDIQGFRAALRKHWAASVGMDSDFKPGTWQENTEMVYEAFRRDISGEGDDRKFETGWDTVDNSGNIGLDGNHAIVLYGPSNNRKTNAAMTMALNFAMKGKRGLFLAGEHLRLHVEKRLTLMVSYYLRQSEDNPEGIPMIPGLPQWEGTKRTATGDDLENVGRVLGELRAMRLVPGYIEVQNIQSLTRGEEDPLGTIMAYVDAQDKKYQWDFIVIDPLDSILPTDVNNKDSFKASAAIVDRMFDYSRGFRGDRGLLIIVTAQFRAETRREIEKVQQKNAGGTDDYDDEIVALLRRDSNIQYIGNKLTQRFDLAIGVALRTQNGEEGMLVQGRSRQGGNFEVMDFHIEKNSNLMLEAKGGATRRVQAAEGAPTQDGPTIPAYDRL